MKFSSAAITVAAISLLSTTHAAPLSFENGEITGHLHHRRGSDLSAELSSDINSNRIMDELDIGFEPGSSFILPRIFNFVKRQLSSNAATSSVASESTETGHGSTAGSSGTTLHSSVMTPDLESYGFSTEIGGGSALAPVKEVKE